MEKILPNIFRFTLSEFYTNNYCIIKNGKVLLIDCTESKPIIDFIKNNNLELVGLILTHGHVDHICGVKNLITHTKIKPFMNKLDDIQIKISQQIYKEYGFTEYPEFEYSHIEEGRVKIGEFEIEVIHTPGHTEGSISLIIDGVLFSGDTIFRESIGRTDLIGGCFDKLITSINQKIMILPENMIVLPGHGESTTIKHEKIYNPFLK
ncbi:MAG: MBL fold metallo-hydrolase [Candidatus Calescibacterium sp.]|nr:MBL fold metallo-hydrolase [Candidatus Calescibacterium sp.]MCX7972156.1 MBL fold metallo-hydrolase [bacterium]MDW8194845.1 MBL fold metallo-hydrolase [Candidatus Calescibacterium sp.]